MAAEAVRGQKRRLEGGLAFFGSQGAGLPGRIMSASGPDIRHFIRANLFSSGQCM